MFGMTRPLPLRGWGAPKYIRHVERRETSPECGTVLIPEIPHYIRDDGRYLDNEGDLLPLCSESPRHFFKQKICSSKFFLFFCVIPAKAGTYS
ncbi:hypothetical protein BN59_03518 [Legionella massiliensis]|uniref:Uncharacterized protein n=1 Tax=Legionella massiliensis TaxID=1034943 RepID=A0A078KXQ0_9GAMM|nr:hypothetical protein BN59_03518 [Legionella massiliensis]CEE14938.1 hypothetical protein BN1094_03518 [Legionella massiliensis]